MSKKKKKTQKLKTEKKWDDLKRFLKEQRRSPLSTALQVRDRAAQLYQEFLDTLPLRSRQLYFVTLKLDASYPSAIPREQIPEMIRTNPEFYKDWARVVATEK